MKPSEQTQATVDMDQLYKSWLAHMKKTGCKERK